MCGIIGFNTKQKNKKHQEVLLALIRESKIRGLHSFGYAYQETKIITKKLFELPNLDDFFNSNSNCLIYHNRYSTSGDWKNEKNNQPITFDNISIAMNGVISMKPKEEYEQEYDVKCETENDSEIFLRLLQRLSPEQAIKKVGGSCAVVWLKDKFLYAARNESRPLYHFKLLDANFFCSTADIAYRALKIKPFLLKPYEIRLG